MYRESDHIHLIAVTQAFNVPVRIVYMDRGDNDDIVMHDFPEGAEPLLHILYRPGHYDILYI
jgi:ubiquitin thioesterase protein OTUB1